MSIVQQWKLRAEFARRLSNMYAEDVPVYGALLAVSQEVNREVLLHRGSDAERLGGIDRVSAERHGAIRLGTPREMAQAATIFEAMGMYPVGFYDLRDATRSAVPVVSTAFRPVDADELARSPFRVFASMLVPTDRRFFSVDLQGRLLRFLDSRELFGPELLRLADRGIDQQGLATRDAEKFLALATAAFALSDEAADRRWYDELHAVSSVAADIGAVKSTHIDQLTPRVLDIDALYHRMGSRGITMIDAIQGPPRWEGPDVLLRQTAFRGLAEAGTFREADGNCPAGNLSIRFGEVEARGIALTRTGRCLYDRLITETEDAIAQRGGTALMSCGERNEIAADIWRRSVPLTENELASDDLAYFTFRVNERRSRDGTPAPHTLRELLEQQWVIADPIVYEDFLPKSTADIFQSNFTSSQAVIDTDQCGSVINRAWLEDVLLSEVADPYGLYDGIRLRSLDSVAETLSIPEILDSSPSGNTNIGGQLTGRSSPSI